MHSRQFLRRIKRAVKSKLRLRFGQPGLGYKVHREEIIQNDFAFLVNQGLSPNHRVDVAPSRDEIDECVAAGGVGTFSPSGAGAGDRWGLCAVAS